MLATVGTFTWASCGSPPCVDGTTCSDDDGGLGGLDSGARDTGRDDDAFPTDSSRGDGATRDGSAAQEDGGLERDGSASTTDGSTDDGAAATDGAATPEDGATATDGAASPDGGGDPDASADAGAADAGQDSGPVFPGGCTSGATGNYAARFRWAGNGPSSRAYVQYDVNNFLDNARWRAGAYSRSGVGYNPVFTDTFLGVGGLEMGSTVFMDVELSTARLSTIRRVTLAVFGRSFNTTAGGSFSWMTFDGSGATPTGSVSNVAPYRWYLADATAAFRPGNAGVLLRISPGGPSGTLIVSRVEVCIDGQ